MRKFQAVVAFTSTSKTKCADTSPHAIANPSPDPFCTFKKISVPFELQFKADEVDKDAVDTWFVQIEYKITHFQQTFSNTYYKINFSDSADKGVVQNFKSLDEFRKFLKESDFLEEMPPPFFGYIGNW